MYRKQRLTAQTLGKQTLICIETEAPITTSVFPQRPQWGKQEAGSPPPLSLLHPSPPLPLSTPQRRAVLDHMAAGDKTCTLVNTQESHRGCLICKRVTGWMPLSYYFFVLYVRGRLVPICSAVEQGWPHLFATRVRSIINLCERTFSEIKPPFISP